MRRRAFISLFLLAVMVLWVGVLLVGSKDKGEFRFEHYESYWGFGDADEIGAESGFLQVFPTGTPLKSIVSFFQTIGGQCFELPIDWPEQLTCTYSHRKYWYLPYSALLSTWSVVIWFEGESRISRRIKIVAGTEGP
jgi:hypothetical protein